MVYYVGDQVSVACQMTSGTNVNATGTSFWLGQITDLSLSEGEGYFTVRYAGLASRDIQSFVQGPQTWGGTINFNLQDMRVMKYVLGSCTDNGSPTPSLHTFRGTNNNSAIPEVASDTMPAFAVQVAKSVLIAGSGVNMIRNLYGCFVDKFSMSASENGVATCSLDFIARGGSYLSGAIIAVTDPAMRPFLWSDMKFSLPTSGTAATANVKSFTFSVANNLETPNFVDATRTIATPIPTNRDYDLAVSMVADSTQAKVLYEQYFRGGSVFNFLLVGAISTGSREFFITGSNAKITSMSIPDTREASQTYDLTINPLTVTIVESGITTYYNGE